MKNNTDGINRKNRDWDSTFTPGPIQAETLSWLTQGLSEVYEMIPVLSSEQRAFMRSSECDDLMNKTPKKNHNNILELLESIHAEIAPKLNAKIRADLTFNQIGTLQSHNGNQENNSEMYGVKTSKYYGIPCAIGTQDNENLAIANEPNFESAQKAITGGNPEIEKISVPDSDESED